MQVSLMTKSANNFNFTPANIHAVKNSIHLTASENGEFMEKPEPDE